MNLPVLFTLLRRRFLSYRNQSIDLLFRSMDWFLYDRDLHLNNLNQLKLTSCFKNLKVRTFKSAKYLTPPPHLHFNKRVTSLKQQMYAFGQAPSTPLPGYELHGCPLNLRSQVLLQFGTANQFIRFQFEKGNFQTLTQPTFSSSKSTTKTLKKGMKYLQS